MNTLSILNGQGDTKLTWDANDPTACDEIRRQVAALKDQGYLFFLVDGRPADEVAAGGGELVVRRMEAEEVAAEPAEPAPTKRRGRPPRAAQDQSVVAVRPLRGG